MVKMTKKVNCIEKFKKNKLLGNFKKLNLAYSKIGNMFKSSSASSKVLTGSLVKAYAAIKSIEKGFDKLSASVKNSMDFVETFNYWNVDSCFTS